MKGHRGPAWGKIRQQQVGLAAAWLAWGAIYFVGYEGQWRESAKMQAQLAPLYKRIGEYGDRIAQAPGLSREAGELEQRLEKIKESRLSPDSVPRAIQQLAQAAGETAVTLEAINPREELPPSSAKLPEGIGKKMVEVRLRCDLQAFGGFLGKITGEGTRFSIEQMTVRSDPKDPAGPIHVELLVSTYGLV